MSSNKLFNCSKIKLGFAFLFYCLPFICSYSQSENVIDPKNLILNDSLRNRIVPVTIYNETSKNSNKKNLVVINPGYGEETTSYSFIANKLTSLGYYVVSIGHELSTDEPLAVEGNLYELRLPVWQRGVRNILFAVDVIGKLNKQVDFSKFILIGHSNGGDISMLFAKEYPERVLAAITLDHRRMPIPKNKNIGILSIRADEFDADENVIPSNEELNYYKIKIATLQNTKHNDLTDLGSDGQKQQVIKIITEFLEKQTE